MARHNAAIAMRGPAATGGPPDPRETYRAAERDVMLRVAAGRVFGYARLDRHREITKLVPGFAKL